MTKTLPQEWDDLHQQESQCPFETPSHFAGETPAQESSPDVLIDELPSLPAPSVEEQPASLPAPSVPATSVPEPPAPVREADQEADQDQPAMPAPVAELSKGAIDKRLRRIFVPRGDGSYLVSEDFVKKYHSKGEERDKDWGSLL